MILRYGIRGIFQIDKRSNVREDASIGDRRRSGKLIGRLNEAEKDWVRYLTQWPLPAALVCRGIQRRLLCRAQPRRAAQMLRSFGERGFVCVSYFLLGTRWYGE